MNLFESLRASLTSLRANKLRAVLTMSGIVMGTFLVFVMYSVGSSATGEAKKVITDLAPNAVGVVYGYFPVDMELSEVTFSPSEMLQHMEDLGTNLPLISSKLKPEMAYPLQRELPEGCLATPLSIDMKRVEFGSRSRNVFAYATNENYPAVRGQSLMRGRYFTARDEGRRVCVLGSGLNQRIFGDIDPVGREIRVNGRRFRVLGVLEPKGKTMFMDNDDMLLLPYWVGGHLGPDMTDGFLISAPTPEDMRDAKAVCTDVLERQVGEKTCTVITQEEMLALAADATRIVNLMSGIVTFVGLLVGGIGIMNIMLVAVSERIREIGIRKAMGAKATDILKQFLLESLLLGIAGGIIGILMGVAFLKAIEAIFNFPAYIGFVSILLALLFSMGVGIIFGVWPAMKAAALDPVEALGHEL
ncbi:MAG: ABC transporter permease [Actinobacteria bacterium]|nr:ABC transporter permease [Actinomycetota bacterium]